MAAAQNSQRLHIGRAEITGKRPAEAGRFPEGIRAEKRRKRLSIMPGPDNTIGGFRKVGAAVPKRRNTTCLLLQKMVGECYACRTFTFWGASPALLLGIIVHPWERDVNPPKGWYSGGGEYRMYSHFSPWMNITYAFYIWRIGELFIYIMHNYSSNIHPKRELIWINVE